MKILNIKLAFTLINLLIYFISQAQISDPIKISGIYPHLAVYNPGDKRELCGKGDGNECGIGAVVPWAGKLWIVTYSAFCPNGSSDKLWTVDSDLHLEINPSSIGGTPANRLIHKESKQLIIGPYFIDQQGSVRSISYTETPGRFTATARHLFDPENMVYMQDMEGGVYEINVHNLEVNKLFEKPVPDWHGKGAYTGQGRYILSNNGGAQGNLVLDESLLKVGQKSQTPEEFGCLAEWDGETWRIIERRQFTEITGPGGIYGNEKDTDPVWSMGWDKRSVILKLLDNGKWHTFRLPKATNTYDFWQGHYTEWPRIREVTDGKFLMDMHGMFYQLPRTFSNSNTAGLLPIASHLRVTTDFCQWNDQIVIANDETTLFGNPFAGRSMSNIWFGQWADIKKWGPVRGYGSIWCNDLVKEGQSSDPFLINGFDNKVLHLAHDNFYPVKFTIEVDKDGTGNFETYKVIDVPAKGYKYFIFPVDNQLQWVRITSDTECHATATFHFNQSNYNLANKELFYGLADIDNKTSFSGKIRPAGHNMNLQLVDDKTYYEVDEKLNYSNPESRADEINELYKLKKDFEIDDASVIMEINGVRVRLPKGNEAFDKPFEEGWPRGIRELTTERFTMNIHGTFYEVPQTKFPITLNLNSIRPIASHNKKIMDFCTWRGLLVMSGVDKKAKSDGHVFKAKGDKTALWFGAIDDLWKLGKPVGTGGPWKDTDVIANEPSDKYLMTGYDKKTLEITADNDVIITTEIDVNFEGWHTFKQFNLKAGEKLIYNFPDGFNAHWIRFKASQNCKATAWLVYE